MIIIFGGHILRIADLWRKINVVISVNVYTGNLELVLSHHGPWHIIIRSHNGSVEGNRACAIYLEDTKSWQEQYRGNMTENGRPECRPNEWKRGKKPTGDTRWKNKTNWRRKEGGRPIQKTRSQSKRNKFIAIYEIQ